LNDPRLTHAVQFLTDLLWEYRNHKWEIGPKGHAIHSLVLYDERVFGSRPGEHGTELAKLGARVFRR
jgi:hypothetical protein